MLSTRQIVVAVLLALAADPARAEDGPLVEQPIEHPLARPDKVDAEELHLAAAMIWASIEFGIPGLYYWNTQSQQSVDWTLDGSWSSWKKKLTLQTIGWDTNDLTTNGVHHPLFAIGDYHIARTNGFGVLGSELFTIGAGIAWEYLLEYREDQALNDILVNAVSGVAIGEPLYQFGQLWRSNSPSLLDRARTTMFSPWDGVQDVVRHHPLLVKPKAWSEFRLASGWLRSVSDDGTRHGHGKFSITADLVNHADYLRSGAHSSRTSAGAWSRIVLAAEVGDDGGVTKVSSVQFHSETSLGGRYTQDGAGHGMYLGVGSGFSYHRDLISTGWDHGVYGHLVGPQLQLVSRNSDAELRWDLAAYADFAMIDAHAFVGTNLLPPPLPMYSTVQARGYYDGWGGTVETRLRARDAPWWVDAELVAHRIWQINALDRATVNHVPLPDPMYAPHHIADWRGYAHASLGLEVSHWGIALELGGALLRGTWHDVSRTSYETSAGLSATLGF